MEYRQQYMLFEKGQFMPFNNYCLWMALDFDYNNMYNMCILINILFTILCSSDQEVPKVGNIVLFCIYYAV